MPNRQYIKGRRKEYAIIHDEKVLGRLAFRSAGSHSPVDVVSIDTKEHVIRLIQSKPDDYAPIQIARLMKFNERLNGTFKVIFQVR